ncbi:MAG: DUF6145 family protein [Eubacteriales bacterium]|jgi:hypothetical protein
MASTVLCGANSYDRKYYFNEEEFSILPDHIKKELQILCVTFTENCGGIMTLEYDEKGSLEIRTEAEEADAMYDDINAGMQVEKIRRDKKDLFEALEMFYRVFMGGAH